MKQILEQPSPDRHKTLESVIKHGKISPDELKMLGQMLAIFPTPPESTIDKWRSVNGGIMPGDPYKQFLDPEDPAYNKEKTDAKWKANKPLPPVKEGEPNAGYILASATKNDYYELVLNRPDTKINVSKEGDAISYSDTKLLFNDVARKKGEKITLELGSVGHGTVIDLSEVRLPKGRKLTLRIETAHGMPTIILPPAEENVTVAIEGADILTQAQAPVGKSKPSTINFVAPAATFQKAKVEKKDDKPESIHTLDIHAMGDKPGLKLAINAPVHGLTTPAKTNICLLLKENPQDQKDKGTPLDLAQITSGYTNEKAGAKKQKGVVDWEDVIPSDLVADKNLQEKLRAAKPSQPPMKQPEGPRR